MTWFSTTVAAVLGAAFLVGPGDSKPGNSPGMIIGSQNVLSELQEEQHHVMRMRGPLYDFLGLTPPLEDDAAAAKPKDKQCGCCVPDSTKPKTSQSKTERLEQAWKVDLKLQKGLDDYRLEFLLLTVADPIDSASNYCFDMQLDALQKALSANPDDCWLYSGAYLPWQAYKDRRELVKETPLLRKNRWYQDEPGVLLFRNAKNGTAKPCERKLLLVYLVGELPTLGIQRDALDHAIHEITRLSGRVPHCNDTNFRCKWMREKDLCPETQPVPTSGCPSTQKASSSKKCPDDTNGKSTDIPIRIVGPTFTGGATSLREELEHSVKCYPVQPQIISGSATAVKKEDFECGQYLGATVCSWKQTESALKNVSKTSDIAWLTETGTGFSINKRDKNEPYECKEFVKKESDKKVDEHTFYFPLGISRVRGNFERDLTTARQKMAELQQNRAASRLPFDADETAHDIPAIQTPLMTAATVERELDQIAKAISIQRLRYVGIKATDVRDTIFLAEFIKTRCPSVQLLLPEPHILFTHPDVSESLRGAIVASSYPLFPEGLEACRAEGAPTFVMSSQFHYGTYNAILTQRCLQNETLCWSPEVPGNPFRIACYKFKSDFFAGLLMQNGKLTPRVWLHTVGTDRFYPRLVSPDTFAEANLVRVPVTTTTTDENFVKSNFFWLAWWPLIVGVVALWSMVAWGIFIQKSPQGFLAPMNIAWDKVDIRHLELQLMIAILAVVGCLSVQLLCGISNLINQGDSQDNLAWITEGFFFSGVSLLPPLLCAGTAIVGMCYIKLRQHHKVNHPNPPEDQVSDEFKRFNKQIYGEIENAIQQEWTALEKPRGIPLLIMGLCFFSVWTLIFISTVDVSGKPELFWSVLTMIFIGSALWWLAAYELVVMYDQLKKFVNGFLNNKHESTSCFDSDYVFKELNEAGLRGLYRLLFRAGHSAHDPVVKNWKRFASYDDARNALTFFRQLQFRMVMIRNQFWLLLLGALLLATAIIMYPFTAGVLLNSLSTCIVLSFAVGTAIGYIRLEMNEDLSKILGTNPNEVDWNFESISQLGLCLLLGVGVVMIQFVPGTGSWLVKAMGSLAHLSH